MKFIGLISFIATLGLAQQATPELIYKNTFIDWAHEHQKVYSVEEFFDRYNTFKDNMDFIKLHNSGSGNTFSVGLNEYADMTNGEFMKRFLGYKPRGMMTGGRVDDSLANVTSVPSSVDWRKKGVVSPVKNQGQCGSCWAFSTTGSVESCNAMKTGKIVELSEQQLVDCSDAEGNQGCNGGLMDDAFKYIEKNHGLCSESAYPYKAQDGTCKASSCSPVGTITGYTDVPSNNCKALQAAAAGRPVSIAVDAAGLGWQLYKGGVFTGKSIFGGSCGTQLDHGVLLVGYDTSGSEPYWIVKNSWGATWGEQGYIRMRMGNDGASGICGMCMQPSYPEC